MPFADLDRNQLEESRCSAAACRALWCAVINQQLELALAPSRADLDYEIAAARRWFGSRDFHMICNLIGLNGTWIDAVVQPKLADAIARETRGESLKGLLLVQKRAKI